MNDRQNGFPPWRYLLPISLGTALSLLGDTTLYTVLPTHTAEAGVAFTSIGLLLSLNRWVRLPLNGPVGRLLEKRRRKPLFVAALFLGALSTLIYALNLGYAAFLFARAIWGVAWVGIWLAGNMIALDISASSKRGRNLGIYQIAFFAGAGGGALLGGLLTDRLGYHQAMYINALLTMLGTLIALLFLPESLPVNSVKNHPSGRSFWQARPAADSTGRKNPEPGRRPELATALGLLAVNRLAMEGFLIATIALFLQERLGESLSLNGLTIGTATLTGIGLGGTTLISALAAPAAGSASDRASSRWRTAALWLLPGILGFALLPNGSMPAIIIGLLGVSAASGSNANLATALIGDLGRAERQERRLGVLFTVGDLASAVGPPLAFWLYPWIGLEGVYRIAAALFGLMFLLSVFWARERERFPGQGAA